MKLLDLRKLFSSPEAPDATDALKRATTVPLRATVGLDLALGPDSSVIMLQCTNCGLVMTVTDTKADLTLAYCPKCDVGCSMCKRLHDADGNKLRILERGTEKRRVCDDCCYSYYDELKDEFVSEKME